MILSAVPPAQLSYSEIVIDLFISEKMRTISMRPPTLCGNLPAESPNSELPAVSLL